MGTSRPDEREPLPPEPRAERLVRVAPQELSENDDAGKDDGVLLREDGEEERDESARVRPRAEARPVRRAPEEECGEEDERRHEELGPSDDSRHRLDVDRHDGEERRRRQRRPAGHAEREKPRGEEERRPDVQGDVHDVERQRVRPRRPALDGVREKDHGPVVLRGRQRPAEVVRREDLARAAGRGEAGVVADDGLVVEREVRSQPVQEGQEREEGERDRRPAPEPSRSDAHRAARRAASRSASGSPRRRAARGRPARRSGGGRARIGALESSR